MTFSERMQDMLNDGLAVTKDLLSKAGDKAQQLGEMGVIKVEILSLRSQGEKRFAQLGAAVFAALVEKGEAGLSRTDPGIQALLDKISEIEKAIDDKEARYKTLGGKEADLKEGK